MNVNRAADTINHGYSEEPTGCKSRVFFGTFTSESGDRGIRSHSWITYIFFKIFCQDKITVVKTQTETLYLNKASYEKWKTFHYHNLQHMLPTQPQQNMAEDVINFLCVATMVQDANNCLPFGPMVNENSSLETAIKTLEDIANDHAPNTNYIRKRITDLTKIKTWREKPTNGISRDVVSSKVEIWGTRLQQQSDILKQLNPPNALEMYQAKAALEASSKAQMAFAKVIAPFFASMESLNDVRKLVDSKDAAAQLKEIDEMTALQKTIDAALPEARACAELVTRYRIEVLHTLYQEAVPSSNFLEKEIAADLEEISKRNAPQRDSVRISADVKHAFASVAAVRVNHDVEIARFKKEALVELGKRNFDACIAKYSEAEKLATEKSKQEITSRIDIVKKLAAWQKRYVESLKDETIQKALVEFDSLNLNTLQTTYYKHLREAMCDVVATFKELQTTGILTPAKLEKLEAQLKTLGLPSATESEKDDWDLQTNDLDIVKKDGDEGEKKIGAEFSQQPSFANICKILRLLNKQTPILKTLTDHESQILKSLHAKEFSEASKQLRNLLVFQKLSEDQKQKVDEAGWDKFDPAKLSSFDDEPQEEVEKEVELPKNGVLEQFGKLISQNKPLSAKAKTNAEVQLKANLEEMLKIDLSKAETTLGKDVLKMVRDIEAILEKCKDGINFEEVEKLIQEPLATFVFKICSSMKIFQQIESLKKNFNEANGMLNTLKKSLFIARLPMLCHAIKELKEKLGKFIEVDGKIRAFEQQSDFVNAQNQFMHLPDLGFPIVEKAITKDKQRIADLKNNAAAAAAKK